MAKGYWVTCYRSVSNPALLTRYATVAAAAIEKLGGQFLARGKPFRAYEAGGEERLVIIEFESLKAAVEAYESPEYHAARAILADSVERDVRIIEGT